MLHIIVTLNFDYLFTMLTCASAQIHRDKHTLKTPPYTILALPHSHLHSLPYSHSGPHRTVIYALNRACACSQPLSQATKHRFTCTGTWSTHTYTHIHTHTHTHTHTHPHTHTYAHNPPPAYTPPFTHTHTRYTHFHTVLLFFTRSITRSYPLALKCNYTRMHIYIHSHSHKVEYCTMTRVRVRVRLLIWWHADMLICWYGCIVIFDIVIWWHADMTVYQYADLVT